MSDEIKEKTESVESTDEIRSLTESLKKQMETLTEEFKSAKESLVQSKGNLTENVEQKPEFNIINKLVEGAGSSENTIVIEGKGSGRTSIFAARPEKWY